MRPSDYYRDFVLPTLREYDSEPTDIRRAYLASVILYHFCDCVEHFTNRKIRIASVFHDLVILSPHFQLIRDLAVLAKHFWLDPTRPGNKGRWLPTLGDVHTGDEAAFDDGTYWDDGTSWTDSREVVRVRDANDHPIDVSYALQQACVAIEAYLAEHPTL